MSGQVSIEPDPSGRGGQAVIRIAGFASHQGACEFSLHRNDYETGVFGPKGWQVAEALLPPDDRSADGADLLLHVGPWIVQHVESGVYQLRVPGAGIDTVVVWPDLPLLAQGASNMVAEPARTVRSTQVTPRPTIQRPPVAEGPARPPPGPSRAAPPPVEPPPADQPAVAEAQPAMKPFPPPVQETPHRARWPWALAAVLLLAVVGGGAYYYYFDKPDKPPGPRAETLKPPPSAPPPAAPAPSGPAPSGPSSPGSAPSGPSLDAPPTGGGSAGPSDLSRMSVLDLLRGNLAPDVLMREAERRMKQDEAGRGDALRLLMGVADKGHAPAHAALGRFYDPTLPHPPDVTPDARQSARHYRDASAGGDSSVDAPRAALKGWLEQRRDDPFAPLILKEFW